MLEDIDSWKPVYCPQCGEAVRLYKHYGLEIHWPKNSKYVCTDREQNG